jgi:methylthioribulose-1-phosphate dehydratase
LCFINLSIINIIEYSDEKLLLCELCRQFYHKGWVSGTGGGITMKLENNLALIAPSGVQKEKIKPEDLLVELNNKIENGYKVLQTPNSLKISACTNIFINIYKYRPSTKAIIHSHSINAVMLTKIAKGHSITITSYEMLKGLAGGKYSEPHTVPILDNVEYECDLAEAIGQAALDYPQAHAVLVRDHGVYIWGNSPEQAQIHAECYDYLFEAFTKERALQVLNLL